MRAINFFVYVIFCSVIVLFTYNANAGSCVGNCDAYGGDGCWCDDICKSYGDCCSDYQSVCLNQNQSSITKIIDNNKVTVYAVPYALTDNSSDLKQAITHQAISQSIGYLFKMATGVASGFGPLSWYSFAVNIIDLLVDPIKIVPVGDITDGNTMYKSKPAVELNDTGSVGAVVFLDYIGINYTDFDVSRWGALYLRVWSLYNFGTIFDEEVLLSSAEMRSLSPLNSYIIVPKISLNTDSIIGSPKPEIRAIARWKNYSNFYNTYEGDVVLLFNEENNSPGSSCGSGKVYDCVGECVSQSQAQYWTGDGVCDDGYYGLVLTCSAFNNDGGDCNDPGANCGSGKVYDCGGECVSQSQVQYCKGDGVCNDGYGMDLGCSAFNYDGGDCNIYY